MSVEEYQTIMGTLTPDQFRAFRVNVLTERRLRTSFPRAPDNGLAMKEALLWALDQVDQPGKKR